MATDKTHGLAGSLALDERAAELQNDDEAPIQNDLFAGGSVFGTLQLGGGRTSRVGPGRPKGSKNRSTSDLVKLIQSTGRHPLLAMAEIVSTPIDVIARTLDCSPIAAAEYQRKVMADLAPYVAQKMPTAVQVEGATAGMLTVVQIGAAVGASGVSDHGLTMTLAAAPSEENQGLSEDGNCEPHEAEPHGNAKSLKGFDE